MEAIDLADERDARGPELLPHLIGEAHQRVGARKAAAEERARALAPSAKRWVSEGAATAPRWNARREGVVENLGTATHSATVRSRVGSEWFCGMGCSPQILRAPLGAGSGTAPRR
jgi:hypothetical protein